MDLSKLIHERGKIERAIEVADKQMYGDLLDSLQERRAALNMLATHLHPRSKPEAIFLHDLIEEQMEFIDDEPTRGRIRRRDEHRS